MRITQTTWIPQAVKIHHRIVRGCFMIYFCFTSSSPPWRYGSIAKSPMNIPNVIYQWVFSKALASGRSEHQQGIWKVALLWYHTSFTMISYISYPLCWNISKASGRLRYYDITLVSLWYHTHDIIHIYCVQTLYVLACR